MTPAFVLPTTTPLAPLSLPQLPEIDLTPVNHGEAQVQKLVVAKKIEAWVAQKRRCCEQQPRIALLSPRQLLDLLRALDDVVEDVGHPRPRCDGPSATRAHVCSSGGGPSGCLRPCVIVWWGEVGEV
jgi:hypothetical protein